MDNTNDLILGLNVQGFIVTAVVIVNATLFVRTFVPTVIILRLVVSDFNRGMDQLP